MDACCTSTQPMGISGSCACSTGPLFPRISQIFGGAVNPYAATTAEAFAPAIKSHAFEASDFLSNTSTENESNHGYVKPPDITAIEILCWAHGSRKSHSQSQCLGFCCNLQMSAQCKFPIIAANVLKREKVLKQKAQALGIWYDEILYK